MLTRNRVLIFCTVVYTAIVVAPAHGYIHFPPTTMSKLCEQSRAIRVLKIKKHDKQNGVIVFEVTETLKGKTPDGETFKHVIGKANKGTQPIFDWVANGKQAVMFTIEASSTDIACGYVLIDKYCYSVDRNATGEYWLLIRVDPEMAATFFGTVETLQQTAKDVLAGRNVKVSVDESVKHLTLEERRKLAPAVSAVMNENRKK